MVEQVVGPEHVLELAQQAVQGDHADVGHASLPWDRLGRDPALVYALFTIAMRGRRGNAEAEVNDTLR
jgi:hypothetical protein